MLGDTVTLDRYRVYTGRTMEVHAVKRMKPLTKKLFIEELEKPRPADSGLVTTLAIGEESDKGDGKIATTLALGEETDAS